MTTAAWYITSSCFAVVSCAALVQLSRLCYYDPSGGMSVTKQLHLAIFLSTGFRASVELARTSLSLDNCDKLVVTPGEYPDAEDLVVDFVWSTAPTFFFFTATSLLLLYWVQRYWDTKMPVEYAEGNMKKRLTRSWMMMNLVVWLSLVVVGAATALMAQHRVTCRTERTIQAVFVAVVSMMSSLGYAVYGRRLLHQMGAIRYSSDAKEKRMKQITRLAWVCAACFTLRAPLVLLHAYLQHVSASSGSDTYLKDVMAYYLMAYFAICELLPAIWILVSMRRMPNKRPPSVVLSTAPELGDPLLLSAPTPIHDTGVQPFYTDSIQFSPGPKKVSNHSGSGWGGMVS